LQPRRINERGRSALTTDVRGLTWIVIDDMSSGHLTIGGRPVATECVDDILACVTS
jgi:hypothetical protein